MTSQGTCESCGRGTKGYGTRCPRCAARERYTPRGGRVLLCGRCGEQMRVATKEMLCGFCEEEAARAA